jgi:putative colanic acid biosysnthesis UDP-glucose lipid carrier transferase
MRTRIRILLQLLIDLALLNMSTQLVALLSGLSITGFLTHHIKVILLLNAAWIVSYIIYVDDLTYTQSKIQYLFGKMGKTFILFIAMVSASQLALGRYNYPYLYQLWIFLIFFLVKLTADLGLFFFSPVKNGPNMRSSIIIGNNPIGNELFQYFQKNTHLGLDPIGILDMFPESRKNHLVIGSFQQFQEVYDKFQFQDVVIALPLKEMESIKKIIDVSERNGVRPHIAPNYFGIINRVFQVHTLGNIPLLTYRNLPLDRYPNRFWKRAFDLAFAFFALLVFSPLLLIIAVAIKLDSHGPVFYRPVRLGVNNKPFKLFKFRSMKYNNGEEKTDTSTVREDSRFTRVGRILRKFNLDEFPQMFNVLDNEMSIVGPRPHRVSLNKSLEGKIKAYRVRHLVKPGITGWAQVNGFRGPMETRIQTSGRVLHDLWYLENWNFGLDIYIIFLTVFSKKAYKNAF